MKFTRVSVLGSVTVALLSLSQVASSQYRQPGEDRDYPSSVPLVPGLPPGAVTPDAIMNGDPLFFLQRYTQGTGAFINCNNPSGQCVFKTPTQVDAMLVHGLRETTQMTQQRYRELVDGAQKSVEKVIAGLWKPDGLMGLSMHSQGSRTFIESQSIFSAFSRYQSSVVSARAEIEILSSFFNGELDGTPLEDKERILKSFPVTAQANVKQLLNVFAGEIKAINRLVCGQNYLVIFPTGERQISDGRGNQTTKKVYDTSDSSKKIIDNVGIHPFVCLQDDNMVSIRLSPKAIQILRADIDKMRNEMESKRTKRPEVIEAVHRFHTMMREDLLAFVETWGEKVDSRSRWTDYLPGWIAGRFAKQSQIRAKTMEDAYNDIIRDFWIRSLFRKIKGLPIGAFKIKYDEAWNTFDIYKSSTLILANMPEEPLYDEVVVKGQVVNKNFDREIRDLLFVYEKAVNKAASKAAATLKSPGDKLAKGLDGNDSSGSLIVKGATGSGLFDYASSSYEYVIKGEADRWKAMYLVLKLMAADAYEEKLVRSPGGMAKMQDYYKKRYFAIDPVDRKFFEQYKKEGFVDVIQGQRGVVTARQDVQVQDKNSLKGVIAHLRSVLNTWTSMISEARILELQIRAAQQEDTTEEFTVENERADDI